MNFRLFLPGLLVAGVLAALGTGGPAAACSIWEHQWVVLQEVRSHVPGDGLLSMWNVWYVATFGKDPPRPEIYQEASSALPVASSSSSAGMGDSSLPSLPPAGQNRLLVYAPDFEEQDTWKCDEALLPDLVLRWEHTERAIVRWTELDPSGNVLDIGETPLLYGWNQTLALGRCLVPIVQFQRITSSTQSTSLFSLLEALLPRAPEVLRASATATPEPEAHR